MDRGLNLYDLDQFMRPEEIITETEGWREIGLPENLVVIATDAMGNKFCVATENMRSEVPTAPVYFWDHDFADTSQVGKSFSAWLDNFTSI